MAKKHAYLVMAHNNFYILDKLLRLLDVPGNDIYLHIDKKVKSFDFAAIKKNCKSANIYFPKKRINVKWGTQSQVLTELLLYKTAWKNGPYHYYHLLSGVDLPLKPQEEIHAFFADKNKNYIASKNFLQKWDYQRVSRYHGVFGHGRLNEMFCFLQEKFKVDRLKYAKFEVKRGYNWASLTQEGVETLLRHVPLIKKMTRFSRCADEVYKQTVLHACGSTTVVNDDLRFVDWSAGGDHPHVLTKADLPRLLQSDRFFARKFCESEDREVVDMVFKSVMSKQEKQL